jgi:hypothetical protein
MTDEELDQYIEREYKANRPVAAGALLTLRCLGLPEVVTRSQGQVMQECFTAGVYYALALLRGAVKASGAQPLPPGIADLFEQLYGEVYNRIVLGRIDIEAQFVDDVLAGTKH